MHLNKNITNKAIVMFVKIIPIQKKRYFKLLSLTCNF